MHVLKREKQSIGDVKVDPSTLGEQFVFGTSNVQGLYESITNTGHKLLFQLKSYGKKWFQERPPIVCHSLSQVLEAEMCLPFWSPRHPSLRQEVASIIKHPVSNSLRLPREWGTCLFLMHQVKDTILQRLKRYLICIVWLNANVSIFHLIHGFSSIPYSFFILSLSTTSEPMESAETSVLILV